MNDSSNTDPCNNPPSASPAAGGSEETAAPTNFLKQSIESELELFRNAYADPLSRLIDKLQAFIDRHQPSILSKLEKLPKIRLIIGTLICLLPILYFACGEIPSINRGINFFVRASVGLLRICGDFVFLSGFLLVIINPLREYILRHRATLRTFGEAFFGAAINRWHFIDWLLKLKISSSGVAFVITCWFVSMAETLFINSMKGGYQDQSLAVAALISLAFPYSAIQFAVIVRAIDRRVAAKLHQTKTSFLHSCSSIIRKSIRNFFVYEYPFLTGMAGSIALCAALTFQPVKIGEYVANWLVASAADAASVNAIPWHATGVTAAGVDQFVMVTSGIVMLVLMCAFGPFALHASAFLQLFIQKYVCSPTATNLCESLIETLSTQRKRILLQTTFPKSKIISQSLIWIVFCYVLLFCLVAFCPPGINEPMWGWLDDCLRGANFHVSVRDHLGLRLFIASICAAFYAGPLALTGCVFLPNAKDPELFLNSQGILVSDSMISGSALKLWSNLRRVSISGFKPNKLSGTLRFHFGFLNTISIKVSSIPPGDLADLLSAADQYGDRCQFDAKVVSLRNLLNQHGRGARDWCRAKARESTIFAPHVNGDMVGASNLRIVRQLSSKPMSAVYLARTEKRNLVIVKQFVVPNDEQSGDFKTSFSREYEILKTLNHPKLAGVLDLFESNGSTYLVLQHVAGEDLRSIVATRGARDERTILSWARQICEIMSFLHAQSPAILHRDLTPDNIMIDETGTIKIIDFGAAHQFMEGVTGTLIGKQAYISPEQLRGKANCSSDIYSFGATLYFLATGKDPKALRQSSAVEDGASISPFLDELIRSCTAFSDEDRPTSFDDLLEKLKEQERAESGDSGHHLKFKIKIPRRAKEPVS